jgi:5-methylcytosine-specific restriction endonuclease McrA
MTDIAQLIEDMVIAGVAPELIGRTAAAFAAHGQGSVKDEQAERRRAKDRERKASLPKDWAEIRLQVIERDGCECAYCGNKTERVHIDHVFPLSRGGSSELENLVVACGPCNISKKDKTPSEWGARQ